jgi:triacylglycerol lipase
MSVSRFWLLINRILAAAVVAAVAVCYLPLYHGRLSTAWLAILLPLYLLIQPIPYLLYRRIPGAGEGRKHILSPSHTRHSLRCCAHGVETLRVFLLSTAVAVVYHLAYLPFWSEEGWREWLLSAAVAVAAEAVVFWNGMLCLYLYSVQLGVRRRVVGALCGLIPVVQVIALHRIMQVVTDEVEVECARIARNNARKADRICGTKYPILLVHGVFFRDFKRLNYWGRIPDELEANGATIFYGHQHSAASVAECAQELASRIRDILRETGCQKVNVIAHSKGGLDMRYALQNLGISPYVASLTTVNTPHNGCIFADFLMETIPTETKNKIADTYNKAARRLGDPNPDFLAAVSDLTATGCAALEPHLAGKSNPEPLAGIYCQSVGTLLLKASGGRFPMNVAYPLVRFFDGPNDGLVAETAFPFGEKYTLLKPTGQRGISHMDAIDLNRENIEGFDVREFYVELVHDLKERGL